MSTQVQSRKENSRTAAHAASWPLTVVPSVVPETAVPAVRPSGKTLKLSALKVGEKARIVRVTLADSGCRRRFAEVGLYEGTTVRVTAAGDTMILAIGGGRMAISADCAASVIVSRLGE